MCARSCHGARVYIILLLLHRAGWQLVHERKERGYSFWASKPPEGLCATYNLKTSSSRRRSHDVTHAPRRLYSILTDTEIGRTWACRRHVPVSPHVHDRSSRVRRVRDATKLNVLHMTRLTTLSFTRSEYRMPCLPPHKPHRTYGEDSPRRTDP